MTRFPLRCYRLRGSRWWSATEELSQLSAGCEHPVLVIRLQTLWSAWHNFFGEGNSLWLLDMGTSWYFSWKMNYFGILKWKQGLFNIPQSGHESVYLLEPSFHSKTPNNSTFMKNISWCPCLKVRVNFLPRRNYAAHFTVSTLLLIFFRRMPTDYKCKCSFSRNVQHSVSAATAAVLAV